MAFTIIPADTLPDSYNVSPLGSKGQADAFVGSFYESEEEESQAVSYSQGNIGSLKRAIKSRKLEGEITIEVLWTPNGTKKYDVTKTLKNGGTKTFTVTRELRQNHGVKLVRIS